MKYLISKLLKPLMALTVFFFSFSTTGQAQQFESSLLWKIEGKRVETSYLFGTIHMMPKEDFQLKEKVINAQTKSEALMLEIDITAPGMQLEIMQYAMMGDGHTIDEYLADSTYAKIDAALVSTAGVGLAMLKTMKPFVISSFLTSKYVGSEPVSFELVLAETAKNDSMPIIGLESVQEQMAVFDSIPYQAQADELAEMVEQESEMSTMYKEMVELYNAEDLNALYAMLDEYTESDSQDEFLLVNRNMRWIPIIEKQIKKTPSFIAVGAAHLGGEQGVIALLRAAGYKVTPVFK